MPNTPPPVIDAVGLWGEALILDGGPKAERWSDVAYFPAGDPRAGLFDAEGLAIPSALYFISQVDPAVQGKVRFAAEGPLAVDPAAIPGPALKGRYVYGGRFHTHYGHFVLDTLPRWWRLLRRGLRRGETMVVHGSAELASGFELDFVQAIAGALGLRRENFAAFDEPVRLRKLLIPQPAVRSQSYAYSMYGDFCREIGRKLVRGLDLAVNPRPVYLSKTRLARGVKRFVNEGELEAVLAKHGVEIVHPETLPFTEQVRLFHTRTTILGATGSAFHTAVFGSGRARLISLNDADHVHANVVLLDRLGGHRAEYLFQRRISEAPLSGSFHREIALADPEAAAHALLARLQPA